MIDRRTFVAGTLALAGGCGRGGGAGEARAAGPGLELIRAELGQRARLGVAALDTGSGRRLRFDANSRYAMCSTFKLPLAAAVLAGVDRGRFSLEDELSFGEDDLLDHAPVVRANRRRGRLSLEQLCAAIVEVSDNSAANLLLRRIGGPAALTAFIRRSGDTVTRLDRYEEELNGNLPGDARDTTTPAAMIGLMHALLLGNALRPSSRAMLVAWMEGATTGLKRLRAGFPPGWRAGDKTGNGAHGAANDIAIAWPPGRPAILVASYISGAEVGDEARHAAHAAVGRVVAAALL
jgi:beta-lactamase class A